MEYTVQHQDGLFIVRGPIPIPESECLCLFWQSSLIDSVTDWQLAEALNASMVVGSRTACNDRRSSLDLPLLTSPQRPCNPVNDGAGTRTLSMAR